MGQAQTLDDLMQAHGATLGASETTVLSPVKEQAFQVWARQNKITDVDAPDSHYDYRGYFQEFKGKPIRFGVDHFPDTYKQHGHPTFSVESKYSTGATDGGRWNGETFIAPAAAPDPLDALMAQHGATGIPPSAQAPGPPRTWTDTAVDLLPAVGGTIGGIVGGIGGTVAGMGVGGVPGAIGGATLLGGAGEAAKQLINRARGVAAPTSASAAAGDIAVQGGVQGAMEGVGAAVGPLLVKGGQAVYRGFLKPSLSVRNLPKAEQIVRTAIEEALPVTKGGAAQAQKVITELKAEADSILAKSSGEVDLHSVADRLRTWAQRMYNRPGRATSDLDAAMDVANRIDNHPSLAVAPPRAPVDVVPVAVANQVKRDMQSGASSAFGVKSGAEKTAEKQGARLLREGVEAVAPAVGPINARESLLIDAARALERATGREGNLNKVYGTRALVAGAVGGGATYERTGDPFKSAVATVAAAIGLHPAVATRAAILAAKLGAKIPGQAPAAVARAAIQAVSESQQ